MNVSDVGFFWIDSYLIGFFVGDTGLFYGSLLSDMGLFCVSLSTCVCGVWGSSSCCV